VNCHHFPLPVDIYHNILYDWNEHLTKGAMDLKDIVSARRKDVVYPPKESPVVGFDLQPVSSNQ
jgi:hypothetical protein